MVNLAKSIWALYFSTIVVGGMVFYELYTGVAITRGSHRITRRDSPLRYWLWVLFHGAILAILIFFWVSGEGTK